jgi:fatty-acyl-CoA synthase
LLAWFRLAPALESLFCDHGAPITFHRGVHIDHRSAADDANRQRAYASELIGQFDSVRFSGFGAFHSTAAASIAEAEVVGMQPHGLYGSSEVQALFSVSEGENRLLGGGVPVSKSVSAPEFLRNRKG